MAMLMLSLSVFNCSDDQFMDDNAQSRTQAIGNPDEEVNPQPYYASWIYVMDARFSRSTCWTGPGVCFKNGFGDIWDYSMVDNSTSDDVGPIGLHLENNQLHFRFFRSLEEDTFIIEEDVKLNESLAKALGKPIVIRAGEYRVSYDRNKYGDSVVDIY